VVLPRRVRDFVAALCVLPDGRLASGFGDNTIRLWDPNSGAETARLDVFVLDKHHAVERGKVFPVCGNTWKMLKETRFASHFRETASFLRRSTLPEASPSPPPDHNRTIPRRSARRSVPSMTPPQPPRHVRTTRRYYNILIGSGSAGLVIYIVDSLAI
jgi:hypothetical protein